MGEENIFIFGLKAEEVETRMRYHNQDEVKKIYTTNHTLRKVLDQLIDGSLCPENTQIFRDLYQTLLFGDYGYPDVYMVLRDFEAYCATQEELSRLYLDRKKWLEKAIMNTACAGFFSSDRTIMEYNDQIWHLTPIE